MFTKTTIALAIILAIATTSLAATKKPAINPSSDAYAASPGQGGDAWDVLRHRNGVPSWAE